MVPRPPHTPDGPAKDPPPSPAPQEGTEERLIREFADRFRVTRSQEVAGIPALLAQDRFEDVARVGHQIKGTAPTFGLPDIGEAGARLELAAKAGDRRAIEAELDTLRRLLEES